MNRLLMLSLAILFMPTLYVQATNSELYLPINHVVHQEINEILQKITTTQLSTSEKLQLKVIKKEIDNFYTSAYDSSKQWILFHEGVYNFCKQQYPNNYKGFIAFILGHELKHHYQKEDGSFACTFHGNKETIPQDAEKEAKADEWGHYYARLIGYSPCENGVEMLAKMYEDFNLTDNDGIHPPLSERQKMMETTCEKAEKLVKVYQYATYMSSIGKYSIAANLYKELLEKYQGREMYYNFAINELMDIRENALPSKELVKYQFPLIIEANTRVRSSENVDKIEIEKRLQAIIDTLGIAFQKDRAYFLAKYYQIYAQHLLLISQYADKQPAHLHQNLLENLHNFIPAEPNAKVICDLLTGILSDFAGKKEEAVGIFEQLAKENNLFTAIVIYNEQISKGLVSSTNIENMENAFTTVLQDSVNELINETFRMFYLSPAFRISSFQTTDYNRIEITSVLYPKEKVIITQLNSTSKMEFVKNSGIYIGSSYDTVKAKMGNKYEVQPTTDGEMWIFRKSQVVIVFDKHKNVKTWWLWEI